MNYLAHLHIAQHCQSSLLGNLLGDFVKGNPDTQFSQHVSQGVRLHRFVDSYTDSHGSVIEARQLFDNGTRRFSGIALDMFWDHCLAKRWYEFHSQPLEQFCNAALEQVMNDEQQQQLPERFVTVTQAMWQGQWLSSYQHIENIEFALQRMSNRSARMARLADCFPYLERNYHQLDELFTSLYPQILTASKSF
ncbi:ACP phosphodiesterase [Vibrio brasiliensis]|uniref:Acyl carrier protein phosphodiesterase n=1 Tax=Vibrio brasiliensis LMG 20546 TaxID=945543 RepID=E8LWD8_9VIBR|nr:ACP phosphodiesterase [Vibrio brasiliensis]EGA65001.1 hypothetical protein VIBR0546_01766 [Vibrio brasiliensis LMG 20546]MCG9650792.1 ACP phosphodiesterase [Vibrio brasiliensis]